MSNHTKSELATVAKEKEQLESGVPRFFIVRGLWPIIGITGARRLYKHWMKGKK